MSLSRNLRSAFATTAIGVLLVAGAAHSTANLEQPEFLPPTAAQEAFADAEYGVDPMVTGPVSVAFEKQQGDLGCHDAVWPDIPLGCYPNR